MAVVIPVVSFIGAIPKVQHLARRPFPDVVRLIELGPRKDLIEPALTFSHHVGQLWVS